MYVCIYTRIDEGLFNFGFFSLILFSNINNNANAFGWLYFYIFTHTKFVLKYKTLVFVIHLAKLIIQIQTPATKKKQKKLSFHDASVKKVTTTLT